MSINDILGFDLQEWLILSIGNKYDKTRKQLSYCTVSNIRYKKYLLPGYYNCIRLFITR